LVVRGGGAGDPAVRHAIREQLLANACGLVVDTGINYYGWTREEALAFLRAYLPYEDDELERELIRPAVDEPASLTPAALGAREVRGLRRWAERELGGSFSLPVFHHEVLSRGALPLPVLGSHLEWWIWKERSGVAVDTSSGRPRSARHAR
jgi:uncharacterized protein (DUF885 family)